MFYLLMAFGVAVCVCGIAWMLRRMRCGMTWRCFALYEQLLGELGDAWSGPVHLARRGLLHAFCRMRYREDVSDERNLEVFRAYARTLESLHAAPVPLGGR